MRVLHGAFHTAVTTGTRNSPNLKIGAAVSMPHHSSAMGKLFLLVLVLLAPGSGSPHPRAGDGDQPSRIIFGGGQHHGGTSLVHLLLATDPEIAFLNDTHVPESEGQHLQQVWPTFADRNERHCAPFLKSLCLLNFTSLLAKDSSAI